MRKFPCLFKKENGYVTDEFADVQASMFRCIDYGYISEYFKGPQAKIIGMEWYKEAEFPTGTEPAYFVLEYQENDISYGWIPLLDTNENKKWIEARDKIYVGDIEEGQVYTLISPYIDKNPYLRDYKDGNTFVLNDLPLIRSTSFDGSKWTSEERNFRILRVFAFNQKSCLKKPGLDVMGYGMIFIYKDVKYQLLRDDFQYLKGYNYGDYDWYDQQTEKIIKRTAKYGHVFLGDM